MAAWVPWLIAACAFVAAATLTGRRGLRQWIVGALLAAIVTFAGSGLAIAVLVFVLVSLIAGVILRRRDRFSAARTVTPEPVVGRRAVVLEQIVNRYGIGCIELDGEIWTARAYERDRVIDAGTPVKVVAVRGATALVAE